MTLNMIVGLIAVAVSLLIARFVEKRWGKITILVLGFLIAGIITLFPVMSALLRSCQAPSDAEILYALYGEDVAIQESLDGKSIYIVEELSAAVKKVSFL